jgi:hypothetical protein
MRRTSVGWVLLISLVSASEGTAQVLQRPNPYPAVTAVDAPWLFGGLPLVHAGEVYYPAGPTIFFDGNVMWRTGTYQGIPLYEDAALEPLSIVYVPIGGRLVRPYERRRTDELAGTVGSRTPNFPVEIAGSVTPAPMSAVLPAAFGGAGTPEAVVDLVPVPVALPDAEQHVTIGDVPPPGTRPGLWVLYDGARWYSAGPGVAYSDDRFDRIGEYHGFPVYRQKEGGQDRIYIPSVQGGPIVPYEKNG